MRIIETSRGPEILRLMKELKIMPEYKLYLELISLNNSIFIFDKNYSDLKNYVHTLTTDPSLADLFLPANREQLFEISLEVIRRLHNFVAAAMSLREHALAIYNKHYKKSGRFPEYKERVNQVFGQDSLAQFVMGLRKYCQHYQSPYIGYLTEVSDTDWSKRRTAFLNVEDLRLCKDCWGSAAKEFLTTCEDKIHILDVATQYRIKVLEFYDWFQDRQSEIHSDEIKNFRDKERKLVLLEIADRVDVCLKNRENMPYRGEEIFSMVFTIKEFNELQKFPPGSLKRGEYAIELLQNYTLVPDELKTKIMQLYKEPAFSKPFSLPDVPKK